MNTRKRAEAFVQKLYEEGILNALVVCSAERIEELTQAIQRLLFDERRRTLVRAVGLMDDGQRRRKNTR